MSIVSLVAHEILKASHDTVDDIRAEVKVSADLCTHNTWETTQIHIYESKPVTGTRFKHVVELITVTKKKRPKAGSEMKKKETTVRAHSLRYRE